MPTFGMCETIVQDPKIVLREHGRSITFNNRSRKSIRRIWIDDCVIRDGKRCDYLLITQDTNIEYFVELKGCQVRHAMDQLERTIKAVSANSRKLEKHCFVISSHCPLFTTEIQQIAYRFKKEYNATLTVKNNCLEHDI